MVTRNGEIIVQDFRGINVHDHNFNIDDSEAQIATNLVVSSGAVEVRGGFSLHSSLESEENGGISFLRPYYKRDGSAQLVFSHKNKYYFITAEDTTWTLIGEYGEEAENPYGYQFKNIFVFGSGKLGNKSYKYTNEPLSYTATTISFQNPSTIADSNSLIPIFPPGSYVSVTGSTSNDGIYLVDLSLGDLLFLNSDNTPLVDEAAGDEVTLSALGFSLVSTPANTDGDLRFFTQFGGKDIKYILGGGLETDEEEKNITTLFYTTDPDDWTSGGAGAIQIGPSDGEDFTGVIQNNNLIAYKEGSKRYLDSFYEENDGNFQLREFGADLSSGSVNHESLVVIDGDVVAMVGRGRSIEGYGLEGTASGNARPKQYATNINPILDNLTWQKNIIKSVRGHFFDRKLFYSAPFNSSSFNNILLVGDWDSLTRNAQPSWTTWAKPIKGMATFRDENNIDQFYLASSNEPKIYRYDSAIYDDNGEGYRRQWKSKKFTLGRRSEYGKANMIIIEGFMRLITEFKLTVYADGKPQSWKVNKNQIIQSEGGGGYIGDNYIGDNYIGGNSSPSDKFRYQAIAFIPNQQRYTKNIEIEIENFEPGQYWSLDYLSINEQIDIKNIPARHKNLTNFQ